MTNTVLLREKIRESGLKIQFIAKKLGLTRQGFVNKVENRTDFTAPEIKDLCDLLDINAGERENIFFAS